MKFHSISLVLLVGVGLVGCKSGKSSPDAPLDGGDNTPDMATINVPDASPADGSTVSPGDGGTSLTVAMLCDRFSTLATNVTFECCTDTTALGMTTRSEYKTYLATSCQSATSGEAFTQGKASVNLTRGQAMLDELEALATSCDAATYFDAVRRVYDLIDGAIAIGGDCSPNSVAEDYSALNACVDDATCVPGGDDDAYACVQNVGLGQACNPIYEPGGVFCSSGLYCEESSGNCVPLHATGNECESSNECRSSYCDDANECAPAAASFCPSYG